jgi:hypothetical protein
MRPHEVRFAVRLVWLFAAFLTAVPTLVLRAQQAVPPLPAVSTVKAAAETTSSLRTWLGREAEIEEYIRTAPIVRIEEVPIGVTKPKRVFFAPGGPVESIAWKVLPPGIHRGFWDSYKGDIAAYELDKLLGMGLVPPTVERRVEGERGAAVLWLQPVRMWKDVEKEPKPNTAAWDRQVLQMKMFDNLICNKDRNMGNLLVDPSWNMYLIDHTRAFITSKDLPIPMTRVYRPLWERMLALDEPALKKVLGPWLGGKEIRAILERRDRMKKAIDQLVAARGERLVLVQ